MRQLKHHEQRLLKRVDFLNYKQDQDHRDLQVIRRYHIQNREDYFKYPHLPLHRDPSAIADRNVGITG